MMCLETNWPALELVVRKRCGWPTAPAREFSVDALRGGEMPNWPGALDIMDAQVLCTQDHIRVWLPEPSYMAGAVLDWLWLAIPQWCAPEGWELLHAAAIARGDGITLIVGPSGSGKTTALLEYLDRGAQFLADDAVLVNRETGEVLAWGTDLHLDVALVGERWPELLPATLDFNAKVRLSPQALGYAVSDGAALDRVILLAGELDAFSLRHSGIGFSETASADDLAMLAPFAKPQWWGYRCPDMAGRIAAEHRCDPPSFAVCTPFSGKAWALDRWLASWRVLDMPKHAHVLWLCNAEDDSFWQRLQHEAHLVRQDYPNLQLWRDMHRYGAKDRQVAELWRQIRTRVPDGCEFVFALEDDVLPDPEAFSAMVKTWAGRGGADIVGVPVGHIYQYGEVTALAWDYARTTAGVQVGPGIQVREARRHSEASEVGGISFSCTIFPAKVFGQATLTHGLDDYIASGYDHVFCLEAAEMGAKCVALWQIGATHLKPNHAPDGAVRIRKRRLLVLGEGEHIPDGQTWEVAKREPLRHLSQQIGENGDCDYILLTSPEVRLPAPYIDALMEHLCWNFAFGAVWGYKEGSDGRLGWGAGPGVLLRLSACRDAKAATLDELRAWLAAEGWREGHLDKAHYHARNAHEYVRPTDERRAASPYTVCWLNRDPYVGSQPGFGGDLVQIAGYRHGLRNLGIYADLRPSNFGEFDGYQLVHLNHVQFPWAVQQAEWCDGRLPVVLSPITHGRPRKDLIAPVVDRADHLVCYSRSEAAWYAGQWPDKRISVVPMGVWPQLFEHRDPLETDEPSVLMAGKICAYKGQLAVLTACEKLGVPVRFAGFRNERGDDDEYVAEFQRRVNAYPKAEYLGFLHGEDLLDAYRRSHMHVNASPYWEPFGQVTLDALALGCNIVHTQNSWAAEQFGRVGSLCDPDDAESIGAAIDTELKRRRGWASVRPPTWTEAARCLLPIYEEALSR